ncbi:ROK family protein [Nocardia sp. NPDC051750]|uniref:ROK family protein n=1 Tax=Nocardia sp. NPDC051750 TaxID=3364325 RepID=UPI0037A27876
MPIDERDWIGQVIENAREAFEGAFDVRTLRLLLLGFLAFGAAFLASTKQPFTDIRFAGTTIGNILAGGFFAAGVVLLGLTIASGLLTLRRPARQASIPRIESTGPAVLGGQLVLGIEVAREAIYYGALSVEYTTGREPDDSPLARIHPAEVIPTRTRTLEFGESTGEVYDDLAAVVVDLLTDLEHMLGPRALVGGIAITTPSSIDIRSKTSVSTTGPFPVNEQLAAGLARILWVRHRTRIRHSFGASGYPEFEEQDLLGKIHLDVDSRSFARHDLHQRSRNAGAWRNYACVLVVEGVGAGLVLGGEIYYGSHSSEGEIGHTTVHLGTELIAPGPAGTPVGIDRCDCQLPGVHWEALAGIRGLARLALACDPDTFDRLATAFGRPPAGRDLVRAAGVSTGGVAPADVPREVVRAVTHDPRIALYLDTVVREYARVLTIGIANLVNTLDLEHVVISGPVIDDLDRLGLRNHLWNYWNDYVLGGRNVGYSFEPLHGGWQGAAMLFWDPAYLRSLG